MGMFFAVNVLDPQWTGTGHGNSAVRLTSVDRRNAAAILKGGPMNDGAFD
jgi:hypothetical protein